MNLEEDAMLVATGQMTMNQAREKWSDEWAEFVQALSRWKSIHALLRLARLNQLGQAVASAIDDVKERQKALAELGDEYASIIDQMKLTIDEIDTRLSLAESSKETLTTNQEPETFFDLIPTNRALDIADYELPKGANPADTKAWDQAIAELSMQMAGSIGFANETDKKLKEVQTKIAAGFDEIDKMRIKQMQIQDQYDITKPYAIGLIVADIFYSLAAAIQGGIY